MRMPRSLGIVATAFLALGLGVGIGGAAFSNYFAPSGTTRVGANPIGTSQWDDAYAKTAPHNADRALSEHGKAKKKVHSKDSKRHGETRRAKDTGRKGNDGGAPADVVQHDAGDPWTGHAPTSSAPAQLASTFVPATSDAGGHTAQPDPAKPAKATKSDGTAPKQKHDRAKPDGDGRKPGADKAGASPKGATPNGTRPTARPEAPTEPESIDAPVPVWGRGSSSVDVVQANWTRSTDRSPNRDWTDRDATRYRHHWGSGDTNVFHGSHPNWTGHSSASSSSTERPGDDARSSSRSGHGTGHDAGTWQVSLSFPDL